MVQHPKPQQQPEVIEDPTTSGHWKPPSLCKCNLGEFWPTPNNLPLRLANPIPRSAVRFRCKSATRHKRCLCRYHLLRTAALCFDPRFRTGGLLFRALYLVSLLVVLCRVFHDVHGTPLTLENGSGGPERKKMKWVFRDGHFNSSFSQTGRYFDLDMASFSGRRAGESIAGNKRSRATCRKARLWPRLFLNEAPPPSGWETRLLQRQIQSGGNMCHA